MHQNVKGEGVLKNESKSHSIKSFLYITFDRELRAA